MAAVPRGRSLHPTPFVHAVAFGELSLYNAANTISKPDDDSVNQYRNTTSLRIRQLARNYVNSDIMSNETLAKREQLADYIDNAVDRDQYNRFTTRNAPNFYDALYTFMKRNRIQSETRRQTTLNRIFKNHTIISEFHTWMIKTSGTNYDAKRQWIRPEQLFNPVVFKPGTSALEDFCQVILVLMVAQSEFLISTLKEIRERYASSSNAFKQYVDTPRIEIPKSDRQLATVLKIFIKLPLDFNKIDAYIAHVRTLFQVTPDSFQHPVDAVFTAFRAFKQKESDTSISRDWERVHRYFVNEFLDLYLFLEDFSTLYTSPGMRFVEYVKTELDELLAHLPRWPTKLFWNDGIRLEIPIHSNVASWPVSTLIESRQRSEQYIRPNFYTIMPCRRGSIASLLASLDSNYHSHTLEDDEKVRRVSAYSVSIFVHLRDAAHHRPYDPWSESAQVVCLSIHARTLHIRYAQPRFERIYDIYDASRDRLYTVETSRYGIFAVDECVFTSIIPPVHADNLPVMEIRVLRLDNDGLSPTSRFSDNPLFNPIPFAIDTKAWNHVKLPIVSQATMSQADSNGGYGNACTSFAMTMALFLFNNYDVLLLNYRNTDDDEAYANLVDKIKTEINQIYEKSCQSAGVRRGKMTAFLDAVSLQTIDPTINVTSMHIVPPEVRRTSRCFDKPHPAVVDIKPKNSNENNIMSRFYDAIVNTFESVRGLLLQDLWTLVHSPMMISYNEEMGTYITQAVAIGVTMNNIHSVLIFISESQINIARPELSIPRRYLTFDSANGNLVWFDDPIMLEEYFIRQYHGHQRYLQNVPEVEDFIRQANDINRSDKQHFDMSVYCSHASLGIIEQSQLNYVCGAHLIHDQTDVAASQVQDLLMADLQFDMHSYSKRSGHPNTADIPCCISKPKSALVGIEALGDDDIIIPNDE